MRLTERPTVVVHLALFLLIFSSPKSLIPSDPPCVHTHTVPRDLSGLTLPASNLSRPLTLTLSLACQFHSHFPDYFNKAQVSCIFGSHSFSTSFKPDCIIFHGGMSLRISGLMWIQKNSKNSKAQHC